MRLDHPIFHGPLAPKIELVDTAMPAGYRNWDKDAPARLPAWHVQDGALGTTIDYGMVATPQGFEDTPDAEFISSGVNSKGPTSMALGRQGNWFLWGFAGDPMQMTDSARQVFLNSIVWMKQFDGRLPLTATTSGQAGAMPHRDMAFVHVQFLRTMGDQPSLKGYLRAQYPDELWQRTGGDADALEKFFHENLEWLHGVKQHVVQETTDGDGKPQKYEYDTFLLDADPLLADAGVSNRKPEFFDHFAQLLGERGAADATVKELADNYLPPEAPREVAAFQQWVASVRDRLFFSDRYGYRWYVGPSKDATKASAPAPSVPAPAPSAAGAAKGDGSR